MGIVVVYSLSQMIESGQSPAVLMDAYINRLGHADVNVRWISVESRELTCMGIQTSEVSRPCG